MSTRCLLLPLLLVSVILGCCLLLCSCGGGGTPAVTGEKIADRPGMLGGDSKPVALAGGGAAAGVSTAGASTGLVVGTAPRAAAIGQGHAFWYEAPATKAHDYLVTLQPLGTDEDSDLYVFRPAAAGMPQLGNSRRGHDGNTLATPDWVAFTAREGGRHQFGVYGFSATTAEDPNNFRMEFDEVQSLTAGTPVSGTAAHYDSRWYYFNATAGTNYTVTLTPSSGDPDLFVYGLTSDLLRGSSNNSSGADAVTFTAPVASRHYVRVYGVSAAAFQIEVTVNSTDYNNLFFLHHSTGNGLVEGGDMRGVIADYNTAHGTSFEFWDHGYNGEGLRNAAGTWTGTSYNVPNDNTDPDGLYYLWTSSNADAVACRNTILASHKVIAFKSCFPASAIYDTATLNQYKTWYLAIRSFCDTRPDRLFVVMSTPPLHRLATDSTQATNARAFANWLKSSTYLSGHSNVVCFDLFDQLARANDGTATANMLRYAYESSHSSDDSHPNAAGNAAVGPVFANFLCAQAAAR